ncbi:MAG: Hsp20 family protein [Gammaproteobacteria bacterium]|nr:Hsp20 family protein [Gammaproteobacteria bacterium]
MTMIDFTPLFRTAVGFDHLAAMLEDATRTETGGYPPYNIELTGEDQYRIVMAVAGFAENELELEVKEKVLRITGRKGNEEEGQKYLYRGIATRAFDRQFQLADHVRVKGATLRNGLLHIDLVREIPEAMKPRRIVIGTDGDKPAIEGKAKAA